MIDGFKHKGLRLFFEQDDGSKLIPALLPRIRLILSTPDAADSVDGMNNPIFKLHPLKGSLRGNWAVTVRANWRITFRFENGQAKDVDFVDYH